MGYMINDCPNCITPWKCNGPHLNKMSEIHYSSEYGYFLKNNSEWKFVPFEKQYSSEVLIEIAQTIDSLNLT